MIRSLHTRRLIIGGLYVLGVVTVGLALLSVAFLRGLDPDPTAEAAPASPIRHIIIIDEENHSFNDIFGKYCVEQASGMIVRAGTNMGCAGVTQARLSNGSTYTLGLEPDFGLALNHGVADQVKAIHGGAMDRFDKGSACKATSDPPYGCLTQFDPLHGTCGDLGNANCLPNIDEYADNYAISDHTFEFRHTPSWAGHMILASATIERFQGQNPKQRPGDPGGTGGWGCVAGITTQWTVNGNTGPTEFVPSCIPDQSGAMGAAWAGYTGTQANYVPTIFDRMDQVGTSWRIYGGIGKVGISPAAGWQICPTFWECAGSSQANNVVLNKSFRGDALHGRLPSVSFVVPGSKQSAHPPASASQGDNWVGSLVSAVMSGPDWSSSAIFITYDDCGCFYDAMNPIQYSKNWGVRVPMVIVSPYAKAGYTDETPATFVSMLSFIERTFNLTPLHPCATVDAWLSSCTDDVVDYDGAPTYDYSNAFDFTQAPLEGVTAVHTRAPPHEEGWLRAHPHAGGGQAT